MRKRERQVRAVWASRVWSVVSDVMMMARTSNEQTPVSLSFNLLLSGYAAARIFGNNSNSALHVWALDNPAWAAQCDQMLE